MKILKKIMFSLIFVSIASVSFAETKMRITLQCYNKLVNSF